MNKTTQSNSVRSETTMMDNDDDFDRSSPLRSSSVLRRALQDESGHEYYVYIPAEGATEAPLLVAVHDIDRNARAQAAAFAALCEQQGVVLVAPHFSAERYPNYQRLGRSRNSADERQSATEALDKILDEVSTLSGASTDRFHLFGFGGGGRFAMRYAMLNPERVADAVVVEPGAYTFPDEKQRFPRGIAPSRKRPDFHPDPNRFLRVPICLLESERHHGAIPRVHLEDVDRDAEGDSNTDGRDWIDAMTEAARSHGLPPMVSFEPMEAPIDSFEAFAGQDDCVERVFDLHFRPKSELMVSDVSPTSGAIAVVNESRLRGMLDRYVVPYVPTYLTRNWARISDRLLPPVVREVGERWLRRLPPVEEIRRYVVPSLVVLALIAVLTPIFLWIQYRSTHVVSRDAVVRGHIAEVGAQLDGVVKRIEVDSGDLVVAGQIVVQLENRQF